MKNICQISNLNNYTKVNVNSYDFTDNNTTIVYNNTQHLSVKQNLMEQSWYFNY